MSAPAAVGDVDDCWNRVGVQGDSSCPQLTEHAHCRNCDVYSRTARRLLNVPLPSEHVAAWTAHFARPSVERDENAHLHVLQRWSQNMGLGPDRRLKWCAVLR